MNGTELFDAVGGVDEAFIENADKETKKRPVYRWLLPAAAALVLAAGGAALALGAAKNNGINAGATDVPKAEYVYVPIPTSYVQGEASLIAAFNYEGRLYINSARLAADPTVMGEKIADIKADWGNLYYPEKWQSGRGDFDGSVFAVKGADPSFMLCSIQPGYSIHLYVCQYGMTVSNGADVFESGLKLSESLKGVEYVKYGSVYSFKRSGCAEVDALIESLDSAACEVIDDKLADKLMERDFNGESTKLYLDLGGGLKLLIRLYKDGCARLECLHSVLFKADPEKLVPIIRLVEEGRGEYAGKWSDGSKTLDDCLNDGTFGFAMPKYIPEGFEFLAASFDYAFNPFTYEVTGTNGLTVMFVKFNENGDRLSGFDIEFEDAHTIVLRHGSMSGSFFEASEFTEENVVVYSENGYTDYTAYVLVGSAGAVLSWSDDFPMEEAIRVIRSMG